MNASWDRAQMHFGDGDGQIFNDLDIGLDVIGHEMIHGFIQFTCGLVYEKESGAINEHLADDFGIMLLQNVRKQPA